MAFSELETTLLEKVVSDFVEEHRPPPHIRNQLDLAYRLEGQSIELFEVRPRYLGAPGETMEHSVAKTTYVRTTNHWKVFWMRADLKWHAYRPMPQVDTVDQFLQLVAEDRHACFFG